MVEEVVVWCGGFEGVGSSSRPSHGLNTLSMDGGLAMGSADSSSEDKTISSYSSSSVVVAAAAEVVENEVLATLGFLFSMSIR